MTRKLNTNTNGSESVVKVKRIRKPKVKVEVVPVAVEVVDVEVDTDSEEYKSLMEQAIEKGRSDEYDESVASPVSDSTREVLTNTNPVESIPVVETRSQKMKRIMNSPEVKAKVSQKVKQYWNENAHPMAGKTFSEEAKRNMRIGHQLKRTDLASAVRAELLDQLEADGVDTSKYL